MRGRCEVPSSYVMRMSVACCAQSEGQIISRLRVARNNRSRRSALQGWTLFHKSFDPFLAMTHHVTRRLLVLSSVYSSVPASGGSTSMTSGAPENP